MRGYGQGYDQEYDKEYNQGYGQKYSQGYEESNKNRYYYLWVGCYPVKMRFLVVIVNIQTCEKKC